MACSGLFGAGQDGLINPPDRDKYFTLRRADIVMKSPEIHRLLIHFEVLIGMIEVGISFFILVLYSVKSQFFLFVYLTFVFYQLLATRRGRERERERERLGERERE